MTASCRICLFALLGLLGWVSAASAQESSPAGQDQSLDLAKQHFDEGQRTYLRGAYGEAAEQFLAAYGVKSFPAFLFNAAVCYEKERDFAKALLYYERYLREDPHSQDRALVQQRIAGINKHLNPPVTASQPASQPVPAERPNLPPVDTKGIVVIESEPEGAAIYLGDKTQGVFTRTPYRGSLPAGTYTVIIEKERYKTERKTFVASPGQMPCLYFALTLERTLSWVDIKANVPGAEVYVDKKEVGAVGRTPYTGWVLPGKHSIIIERAGYQPYTAQIVAVAGDVHAVTAKLTKVSNGWLKITGQTTRGASIKIDGRPLTCSDYPCRVELSTGRYKVEVERKGYKKYAEQVEVQQATETQLAIKLNPNPSRLSAYITFGISGVLLAGAITAGVMSHNRKVGLEDDLAAGKLYDSGDSRIFDGKVTAIISNSLYAVSGLVGALGFYYMFRNVGPDSYGETRTNHVALSPAVGPRLVGIAGAVRF